MSGSRQSQSETGSRIKRTAKRGRFVTVGNEVARDQNLTYQASGVLTQILSYAPDKEITTEFLAAARPKNTRGFVEKAMRELREERYALLHRVRLGGGKFSMWTEVFEDPWETIECSEPGCQHPVPGDRKVTYETRATGTPNPVSGLTCGNTTSPQVRPETGKPDSGQPESGFPGYIKKTVDEDELPKTKNEDTPHHHQDRYPPWLREALPDLDDDEIDQVLTSVAQAHQPNNLMGYVRTLAATGDLIDYWFEATIPEPEIDPDKFCDFHRLPYPARGECRGCAADRKAAA